MSKKIVKIWECRCGDKNVETVESPDEIEDNYRLIFSDKYIDVHYWYDDGCYKCD
jgi:hypothetical protein